MTMYKWIRVTDSQGRTSWKLKTVEVKDSKGN